MEFAEIDNTSRKPGTRIELNTRNAVRGLPANRRRLLIIAPRLATGSVAALVPTAVYDDVEPGTYFGVGSIAQRMVMAAIKANRYAGIIVCALDDPAGANAAGTFTFTGPATAPGIVTAKVGKDALRVAIATGDTDAVIAAAIAAAINAVVTLPVTAVAALGVVTVTCKHKGTVGNAIGLEISTTAAGITAVAAPMAGGTLTPDIQDALDVVYPADYELYATSLNDLTSVQALRDHLEAISNGMQMRPARGVVGYDASVASIVTIQEGTNAGRVALCRLYASASPDYEIAAGCASALAAPEFDDPAVPLREVEVPGLAIPAVADLPGDTEVNTMLYSGITPMDISPNGRVRMVRMISSYIVNAQDVADPALLDFNTLDILDYGRKAIRARLSSVFARTKATERNRKAMRSEILVTAQRLEAAEIWENVTSNAAGIIVERDPNEPTRFVFRCPADVVNGLHQIHGAIDMIL